MWLKGGWIKAGSGVQHMRILEILGSRAWSQVGVQVWGAGWARMGQVVAWGWRAWLGVWTHGLGWVRRWLEDGLSKG